MGVAILRAAAIQTRGASMVSSTVAESIASKLSFPLQAYHRSTVAHGNATAGGAYQVALSDYVVLVRDQTHLFLAGPPLLKAATGEEADHETLGGAVMHATVSQTGEYFAESDADGIRVARDILDQFPPDAATNLVPDQPVEQPLYPAEELRGIVSEDKRIPYDMREVIARVFDGSRFFEFEPVNDPHTVCGHAHIGGWRCGIITNNGPITPQGAKKASQFLQLCDQTNTPMIFLQNTTGFLVGVEAEQAGQVKHGSKMIQAVANFRPIKLTIIVGNAYGAGNYAMCSKSLKPEFVFSWPTARQARHGRCTGSRRHESYCRGQSKIDGAGNTPRTKRHDGEARRGDHREHGAFIRSDALFITHDGRWYY